MGGNKEGKGCNASAAGGRYLRLASFAAFFSFPFSLFVPNLKTIFHSPFCAYCAWAQERRENVMRSDLRRLRSARRLKARRKSYKVSISH